MKQYLRIAKQVAKQSEYGKYRVGAVLVSASGIIVGVGNNKRKTHPQQKRYAVKAGMPDRLFLHAEIAALIDREKYAPTIVVCRLTKKGRLAMARPCPVCMLALKLAAVREIYYSNEYGELTHEFVG